MRVGQDTLITEPVPLADAWTCTPILIDQIVNYSIQLFFDGSPNGSFKLQTSNDAGVESASNAVLRAQGVVHWTDYFSSEQDITEAGDHVWSVQNSGDKWVRVVWTPVSGSGNITSARFVIKGV